MPDRDLSNGLRAAEPGELCTCGRQAVDVYVGGDFGATGHCGLDDGGAPVDGVCTFCGDTIDHGFYSRAESKAARPAAGAGSAPQGGRCPLYRLRLTDPLPEVHAESVRRFDRDTDRRERSEGRLNQELAAVFADLGVDFTEKAFTLDFPDDDTGEPEIGTIEDVIFDLCWATRQALSRDEYEPTSHAPEDGQTAVAVLVSMLRPRLDELGVTPNPLVGLDAHALVAAAGGDQAWSETPACDRPLLMLRRVVRRSLTPEAPKNIYRQWWA